MKLSVAFVLLILVISSISVYADGVSITVDQPDEYLAGRNYILELTVTNNGKSDLFSLSILGVPSNWISADVDDFNLDAGETKKMDLVFSPPIDARPFSP